MGETRNSLTPRLDREGPVEEIKPKEITPAELEERIAASEKKEEKVEQKQEQPKEEVKKENLTFKEEKESKPVQIPFHADRPLDYGRQKVFRGRGSHPLLSGYRKTKAHFLICFYPFFPTVYWSGNPEESILVKKF